MNGKTMARDVSLPHWYRQDHNAHSLSLGLDQRVPFEPAFLVCWPLGSVALGFDAGTALLIALLHQPRMRAGGRMVTTGSLLPVASNSITALGAAGDCTGVTIDRLARRVALRRSPAHSRATHLPAWRGHRRAVRAIHRREIAG
jgi:hypothetical protein